MLSDYDILPNNFASSYAPETDSPSSFAEGQADWLGFLISPGNFADIDYGCGTELRWLPTGDFAVGQRGLHAPDEIRVSF